MEESIYAGEAPDPVGPYPHARRAGNLLFLSGVGPRQKNDSLIPGATIDAAGKLVAYDFELQCHAVFRNVNTILTASGAAWENLIDITVFLINMKADFATFNRVYGTYFTRHQPCRTTVEVTALPTPIAVELKCIAWIK